MTELVELHMSSHRNLCNRHELRSAVVVGVRLDKMEGFVFDRTKLLLKDKEKGIRDRSWEDDRQGHLGYPLEPIHLRISEQSDW